MTETMTKAMYYQEIRPGEGCSKCGRPMAVEAKDGKVFLVCFHCNSRNLVSRTPSKRKVER